MSKKMNIGIVFGGKSGEYEISLLSSYNVVKYIDKNKFDVTTIGITRDGEWYIYTGDNEKILDGSWIEDKKNLISNFSFFDNPIIKSIDVFFAVMHGPNGEDGTIQGLFEMISKPYVGCGVLASSTGMDKVIAKILFEDRDIPVVDYHYFFRRDWDIDRNNVIEKLKVKFDYPIFIKPVNMGSSVGISKVHNEVELVPAIVDALKYDNKILVEKFIKGREIECAVLGNEYPRASCVGEIIPSDEFYSYQAKYFDGGVSKVLVPANISEEVSDTIRGYAIKAFEAINGSGLSRVDFFVEDGTGKVYINEINTMPGFTNISMYSKLWEAGGITYSDLITELINLAINRYETERIKQGR